MITSLHSDSITTASTPATPDDWVQEVHAAILRSVEKDRIRRGLAASRPELERRLNLLLRGTRCKTRVVSALRAWLRRAFE